MVYLRGENSNVIRSEIDYLMSSILLVMKLHLRNLNAADLLSSCEANRGLCWSNHDFLAQELLDLDLAL